MIIQEHKQPIIASSSNNPNTINGVQTLQLNLNYKSKMKVFNPTILLVTAALLTAPTSSVCTSTDSVLGCTACTLGQSLVIDTSTSLYTCSLTPNCTAIDSSSNCVQCIQSRTLNTDTNTSATDCNSYHPGCKYLHNNICIECFSNNYYLNSSGICVQTIISYCWTVSINTCSQCSDGNIANTNNCSIPTSICSNFDYQAWKCSVCPTGMVLHQSGVYCLNVVGNCLVYQLDSCIQCSQGYFINSTANTCNQGLSTNLYYQLLPSTYYLTSFNATSLDICLNLQQYFNTLSCVSITNTTLPFCLTQVLSTCTQCIPSFYLNASNICRPCSVYPNCLTCDLYNCRQCQPDYYLAVNLGLNTIDAFFSSASVSQAVTSQCLPCSILGCLYCRNQFRDNNVNKILCNQCLFGYRLYNHTCYLCPDNSYFDILTKNCSSCIVNCQYCNTSPLTCDQCLPNYFFNSTSSTCDNLTTFLLAPSLSSSNSFQVLNRSLPGSSTFIINDQKLLVTYCTDSSNGYVCYCPVNSSVTYTSLCQIIDTGLTTAALDPSLLFNNQTNTSLDKTTFVSNLRTIQLLSELPLFNFDYTPAAITELLSPKQFATYLQIKANYLRNNPTLISSQTALLATFALTRMNNVFDPYSATILAGPGYYFKYSPSAMQTDDTTVVETTFTSGTQSAVFLFYNNTYSASTITPKIFIFQDPVLTNTVTTAKIKKINFLASNQEYQIFINSVLSTSISISLDSQGYLTIPNTPLSTTATQSYIQIASTASSTSADLYSSQRIQNIIYRDSFIYILIVIALYLIFLPLCAIFDCVDNRAYKRKIQRQDSQSYEGVKHKTQTNQNDEQISGEKIVNINYKDFFPLYNIANTQRPRRLLKLCLFIVNLQHSVTFLVLIYFRLSPGQPIVAVILGLPAYLCTLIMGYICGAIVVNLHGSLKYLINIVTLLYWFIWVPLMGMFNSNEYKPYVYVFVIIFFAVDMLLDSLETLLMYFTIKQESKQIKLFQVLSKWLSYRGFYQFNEMAKQIQQARDNQE